jgi:tRNA nucleotidyltransferase (CCA-adding enzyme)
MGLAKGTDELPQHLDFVTARTEFYTAPSVLPTVESSSIKLDLHRRDFTINTLALCLNPNHWGQLLDFYGGLTDLRTGVVRVLHSLSFVDDPTRILRAVRYEQRYGFEIEPRTLELLTDALEMLDRVTPARIRHELERILQESQPEVALARLEELGVLRQFHPDLAAGDWTAKAFDVLRNAWRDPTPDPDLVAHPLERLYWAALVYQLPIETVGLLNERLGLRRETQRLTLGVQWLRRNEEILGNPNARPSEIVAVLDEAEPSAIALFDVLAANPTIHGAIERYRTEWVKVHAELNGNDLRELGIPRGPLYRNILSAVRWARLDGTAGSRNEEVEIARRVAADAGALHVVRNVTP